MLVSMRYLPLACIARHEPAMRARGVSTVARSPRGFLTAWKRAGGDPAKLSPYWRQRRAGFIARHMAQMEQHHEPPRGPDGAPTRRHLALIAWAYSPERGCPRP